MHLSVKSVKSVTHFITMAVAYLPPLNILMYITPQVFSKAPCSRLFQQDVSGWGLRRKQEGDTLYITTTVVGKTLKVCFQLWIIPWKTVQKRDCFYLFIFLNSFSLLNKLFPSFMHFHFYNNHHWINASKNNVTASVKRESHLAHLEVLSQR